MNQAIADIIKGYISGLDFVDKIAGLTSVLTFDMRGPDNVVVQKSFPVACCVTPDECEKQGAYNDLMPNSEYKTVIYFEDSGVSFEKAEGNWKYYKSSLRLIAWLNIEKLTESGICKSDIPCTYAAHVITEIIRALPEFPRNTHGPIERVYSEITSQIVRNPSIFSAYTYDEKHVQYLMAPYDYFALTIETSFAICLSSRATPDSTCVPAIEILPPTAFSVTVISDTQINLAWTNNALNQAVAIERSLNGNNFTEIFRTSAGAVAYSDTELTAGTRYYYRARAFSGGDYSAYTNVEDITTWTPQELPTDIILTVLSDTLIKVDWTDPIQTTSDGIKIYLNNTLTDIIMFGVETSTIINLTTNTLYTVKLVAYKGGNESIPLTESIYTSGSTSFTSVQPASLNQMGFTYKVDTGKVVKINWGYGADVALTADAADHTITSIFPTNNTTYTVSLIGDISYLRKFYIYNEATINVPSTTIKELKGLNYLYIWPNNGVINSADLVGLPLTFLLLRILPLTSDFDTADLAGMQLTTLDVQTVATLASIVIRSSDLVGMPLDTIALSSNAGTFYFDTVDIVDMPITSIALTGYGNTSHIHSADFIGKNLTLWRIFGGFENCIIDSGDLVGMPLITFYQGHTGVDTVIDSADFVGMAATLTSWSLYGDGGTYLIDLADFSGLSLLTNFYISGTVSSVAITAGNLSDLPTGLLTLFTSAVTGLNITTGVMKVWAATVITLTNAHPSADVDAFLNAWATPAGAGTKTITIKNARTAASDAAVTTLNGKGKTINTSN